MRITSRLQLIRYVALAGLLSSILLCMNLWCGQRWFPKAPLIEGLNLLMPPYDYITFGIFIALMVAGFVVRAKWPIVLLLVMALYLILDDQNRLQPWFFNYLLVLLVLLCYRHRVDDPNNYITVFISLQLLVSLIYIYSGIQKLNSNFHSETYAWFIEPLSHSISERQQANLMRFGVLVPYIEICIGIGLLIRQLRFIIVPLVVIMHVFILCMIGPFGKSYNYVVWPWNLVMIVLCLLLFAGQTKERYYSPTYLFRSACFYAVLLFMLILPFFSLANKWPSYLSSSLYSGNTSNAYIYVSDEACNKLPLYIQHFVHRRGHNDNLLSVKYWCMTELRTPCFPERAVFERVRQYVQDLAQSPPAAVEIEFKEREKLLDF